MPDDEKYASIVAKNFNLDHPSDPVDILKEFPDHGSYTG